MLGVVFWAMVTIFYIALTIISFIYWQEETNMVFIGITIVLCVAMAIYFLLAFSAIILVFLGIWALWLLVSLVLQSKLFK